jgi:drug/metabolite transporter (DMT)-like permease
MTELAAHLVDRVIPEVPGRQWVLSLPGSLLADPLDTAPRDLALLALFGVGQFGVGFLLFMAGARLIPAAESSLIGMLEVVLGPLWVWLVLSERPGAAALIGGTLIVAALLANTVLDLVAPRRTGVAGR